MDWEKVMDNDYRYRIARNESLYKIKMIFSKIFNFLRRKQ